MTDNLTAPFIMTDIEVRTVERAKAIIDALMDEEKVIVDGRCIHCGSNIIGGMSVLHEMGCPVKSAQWMSWELRDWLFNYHEAEEDRVFAPSQDALALAGQSGLFEETRP